jgi:hypothetical protein
MRRLIPAVLLALLALPASAHAGFFPAEVIDGPNSDLVSVEDVDISREGTGGAVYLRRDGGTPHVFFTGLVDGAFGAPARLDAGLGGTASDASIAASTSNRMAVAYVVDGSLFTQVKASSAQGFSAPALVASGGVSEPSIDMSINGATYVSYTQNGSVFVARANRDSPSFAVLGAPVSTGGLAGQGERQASMVDVSADGTAVVVWTEAGGDGRTHVLARRIFEQRLSNAPQDLTVTEVGGSPAGSADSAVVDTEDDSSFAQVVFRQETAGGPRMLMRRLVGTTFDPPVVVDGGLPADTADIDLTGRGEGLFGIGAASGDVLGGTIFNNQVTGQARLNAGNGVPPQTNASVGENEDGVVSFLQGSPGDAQVLGRFFEGVEQVRISDQAVVSNPGFGPVFPGGGLEADASRAGDTAMLFLQGGEGDRRLVAAYYDKAPSRIAGLNTQKVRRLTRLAWAASLNLFGGTRYTVIVDGREIAQTARTELPLRPGQIPDGEHRWQLRIVDRRGQTTVSRSRLLRVDNTKPTLRIGTSKKGRVLTITQRAGDPNGALPSGIARVLVDWGDGKLVRMGRKASKRYPSTGGKTVRVKAVDRAGNETVVTRRIQIG